MYRLAAVLVVLLLTTAQSPNPPKPVIGDMGNTTVQATSSNTQRALKDRFSDVINVLDYGAVGDGVHDDGPAIRAAFSGNNGNNRRVYFPPLNYHIVTVVLPDDTVPMARTMLWIHGMSNITVYAYGATFTLDDTTSQNHSIHYVVLQSDTKNVAWYGGTFVGNKTGAGAALGNGMCWNSASNVRIQDVVFTGDWSQGSALCGSWGFGITIDNVTSYSAAIGFDGTFNEDMTLSNTKFYCSDTVANLGYSMVYVAANAAQNEVTNLDGSSRSIRNGQSNNLQIINSTFTHCRTSIVLDDVNGAVIAGNSIIDGAAATGSNAGVLLRTSNETAGLGRFTQAINIIMNVIRNNGTVGGGTSAGILLSPNAHKLENVVISNNIIADNCNDGIKNASAISGMGALSIKNNNFLTQGGSCTQTPINAAMAAALGFARLMSSNNSGDIINNRPQNFSYTGLSNAAGNPRLTFQNAAAGNMVLYSTGSTGADRVVFSIPLDNDTARAIYQVGITVTDFTASGTVKLTGIPTTCVGHAGEIAAIAGVLTAC